MSKLRRREDYSKNNLISKLEGEEEEEVGKMSNSGQKNWSDCMPSSLSLSLILSLTHTLTQTCARAHTHTHTFLMAYLCSAYKHQGIKII